MRTTTNTILGSPHLKCPQKKAYQLDQIFIPKSQLCQTTNVKRKLDGASSDHAVLSIDFHLLNGPLLKNKEETKSTENKNENKTPKLDNNILRNKEVKNFQKKVDAFFDNLNELSIFSTPSELIDEFEEHIKSAALEVAPAEVRHHPDWFTEAEEILMNCIDTRAFKKHMKHTSTENHQALKQARHALLCEKRKAKRQRQFEYANKYKKSDFCLSPKDAWKMVFDLMEGFSTHHHIFCPTNFKYKNGTEAKNDRDNSDILNSHFSSLFNSQVNIDYSVLDNLLQHEIKNMNMEIHQLLKKYEPQSTVWHMKSQGQSGLSTDMI